MLFRAVVQKSTQAVKGLHTHTLTRLTLYDPHSDHLNKIQDVGLIALFRYHKQCDVVYEDRCVVRRFISCIKL